MEGSLEDVAPMVDGDRLRMKLMKCQEVEPVPRRGPARRPMRSLLAVQFPELGQVWTRVFGQALMIGRAQLVERK